MPSTLLTTNTRQTWQQITQLYPDKWVLMKDAECEYVPLQGTNLESGHLTSAVVIFACDDRNDIDRFMADNPGSYPDEVVVACTNKSPGSLETIFGNILHNVGEWDLEPFNDDYDDLPKPRHMPYNRYVVTKTN